MEVRYSTYKQHFKQLVINITQIKLVSICEYLTKEYRWSLLQMSFLLQVIIIEVIMMQSLRYHAIAICQVYNCTLLHLGSNIIESLT